MDYVFTVYDNVTRSVIKGKCIVHSITLCGDGDVGGLTVRNGPTGKMSIVSRLLVASGDSKTFTYGKGMVCPLGLHVTAENANSKYTINGVMLDEKMSE